MDSFFQQLNLELECPDDILDLTAENDDLAAAFDVSPFRLNELFKEVDANDDGNITRAEFCKILGMGATKHNVSFCLYNVVVVGKTRIG